MVSCHCGGLPFLLLLLLSLSAAPTVQVEVKGGQLLATTSVAKLDADNHLTVPRTVRWVAMEIGVSDFESLLSSRFLGQPGSKGDSGVPGFVVSFEPVRWARALCTCTTNI
jgi:hypothetical protein